MGQEDGKELALPQLQSNIVEALQRTSCLELAIIAGDNTPHPYIAELVHFARRLDIFTSVRCQVHGGEHDIFTGWVHAGLNLLEVYLENSEQIAAFEQLVSILSTAGFQQNSTDFRVSFVVCVDDLRAEELEVVWEAVQRCSMSELQLISNAQRLPESIQAFVQAHRHGLLGSLRSRLRGSGLARSYVEHHWLEQSLYDGPTVRSARQQVGHRAALRYILKGASAGQIPILTLRPA